MNSRSNGLVSFNHLFAARASNARLTVSYISSSQSAKYFARSAEVKFKRTGAVFTVPLSARISSISSSASGRQAPFSSFEFAIFTRNSGNDASAFSSAVCSSTVNAISQLRLALAFRRCQAALTAAVSACSRANIAKRSGCPARIVSQARRGFCPFGVPMVPRRRNSAQSRPRVARAAPFS